MKLSLRKRIAKEKLRKRWHQWFAWYPVRIGRDIIWWEWTMRRQIFWANFDSCGHAWKRAQIAENGLGGIDTRVKGGSARRAASRGNKIDSDIKAGGANGGE